MERSELLDVVRRCREAIEACDRSHWGAAWQEFPEGSCDVASHVLGWYLRERYGLDVVVVSGERFEDGQVRTHSWVELEGWYIDITADQFGLGAAVVTTDGTWYALWDEVRRGQAGGDHEWWRRNCAASYDDVVERMNSFCRRD